jgi:hypothetical protein
VFQERRRILVDDMTNTTTSTVVTISLAGISSLLSILLTLFLIYKHLKHWIDPIGQTYIVRILLMVPVYTIASWFSLLFAAETIYFNLVRDCYESFVLYQFLLLLIHYFEKEMVEVVDREETSGAYLSYFESHPHPFPCCCLPDIIPGPAFLWRTKSHVLQYVFIKPTLSIVAIVLESIDLYDESSLRIDRGYPWITLIVNLSMTLCLYSLIVFYDTIEEVIEKHRPLHKLLSIKLLLFFLFWQALFIDTLFYFNTLPIILNHKIVNNLIVCLEMLPLSIANFWIFPYSSYRDGSNYLGRALESLTQSVFNPKDIIQDTKETVVYHL